MRCKEVKQRISENAGVLDRDVDEHIRACPACKRAAQAALMVQNALNAARGAEPVLPLSAVRERVEAAAKRHEHKTPLEKLMSKINEACHARPRLWAGLGAALVVFLFLTLIPFSYSRTVGYQVTVSGVGGNLDISPELLAATLSTVGYEDISISRSSEDDSDGYTFANLSTKEEAEDVAETFTVLAANPGQPEVKPIRENVTWSLLAQAVDKVVDKVVDGKPKTLKMRFDKHKIIINQEEIDGTIFSVDLSDEQVRDAIEKVLTHHGVSLDEISVAVVTDTPKAIRKISLRLPDSTSADGAKPHIDLYLADSVVGAVFEDGDDQVRFENFIEITFPDKELNGHSIFLKVPLKPVDSLKAKER